MRLSFTPFVRTHVCVCAIVLLKLKLVDSLPSSLSLVDENDSNFGIFTSTSSSRNTISFLRSNDESKNMLPDYNEGTPYQQEIQVDWLESEVQEEPGYMLRKDGRKEFEAGSMLELQDHEERQGEREMLWLQNYVLCVESDPNKWETITTRSRLVRAYYRGRGAVPGVCGEQCDAICDHEPCFIDYKIGSNDVLCTCLEEPKPLCGANSKCTVNNQDQEVCTCQQGYTGSATTGCTDINECSTNVCGTSSTSCTNTEGSYDCTCQGGFIYDNTKYGSGCVDFNECTAGTTPCGPDAKCTNTVGSFLCACDTGYQGNPPATSCIDTDECSVSPTRCGADASVGTCVNTPGSFTCSCVAGYTWPSRNGPCIDINECSTPNRCGVNENCINTPGSFSCECKSGFVGNPSGGQPCVDVCSTNPCGPNAKCTKSGGTFSCACDAGYQGNPPATSCADIDECMVNPTRCGTDVSVGTCVNNPGNFTCNCASGFTWPSRNGPCVDVNECSTPNRCGANENCSNTPGSFSCNCKPGFIGNPSAGQPCVDACSTDPCGPNAKCTKLVGNFSCACNSGYQGNPPTTPCTDIDECRLNATRCGADASVGTCDNTPGNFTCTCASGYTWPSRNGPCIDTNECSTPNRCGTNQNCINTGGSFSCVCKSGFAGNPAAGQPCVDINECLDTVNPACGPNSQCTNTVGNFTCKCNSDFPAGNPPKEQCRKLIEREACPQGSTTLCGTGLECAIVSRSDTTNFHCCSEVDKCFTSLRCCNGSYDEGQPCPSGSNLDCSGDLVCERESVLSARKICCNGASFIIGIGNVCRLF